MGRGGSVTHGRDCPQRRDFNLDGQFAEWRRWQERTSSPSPRELDEPGTRLPSEPCDALDGPGAHGLPGPRPLVA